MDPTIVTQQPVDDVEQHEIDGSSGSRETFDHSGPHDNNSIPGQSTLMPQLISIAREDMDASSDLAPMRVPGTHPPDWLPDSQAPACMRCGQEFTLIKRRHHCRSCGLVFCSSCCEQKAKLPYMDNKEARVCESCLLLLNLLLSSSAVHPAPNSGSSPGQTESNLTDSSNNELTPQIGGAMLTSRLRPSALVRSVPNETPSTSAGNDSREPSSSSSGPTGSGYPKQVIFSDGVRPGTDLNESLRLGSSSFDRESMMFERRHRAVIKCLKHKSKRHRSSSSSSRRSRRSSTVENNLVVVSDAIGQLPPIMTRKCNIGSPSTNVYDEQAPVDFVSLLALSDNNKSSRPIKFLLLKNLYLNVQIVVKDCCMLNEKMAHTTSTAPCDTNREQESQERMDEIIKDNPETKHSHFWTFVSEGLAPLGQSEIVLVLDRPDDEVSIPREVFKLFLTLHELALRGRPIGHLGHLLFGEGVFRDKENAGYCFIRPFIGQCLKGINTPKPPFLLALVIQKWEVPWAKLFPLRLLLRLGYEQGLYPVPILSFRRRKPVFYEVGHTIVSILADFRNYQYTITNVPDMSLVINRELKEVAVNFPQHQYHQVFKVLGNSNNEHVLAWCSSYTSIPKAHLVVTQNDEGQYESVEFSQVSSEQRQKSTTVGASFIVFSGSLKTNQVGQNAKISIVEDGLLVQLQSSTMTALRSAVRYMNAFEINTGINDDRPGTLQTIKILWEDKSDSISLDPKFAVTSPIDGRLLEDTNSFQNIKIHSADYLGDGYFIRWTDVYLSKQESGLNNEADPSRLAEEVARAFCLSMVTHLEKLVEEDFSTLGLRISLNETTDQIGFEVGSNGNQLPLTYLKELDCTILPMISASGGSMNLVIELIFYILAS